MEAVNILDSCQIILSIHICHLNMLPLFTHYHIIPVYTRPVACIVEGGTSE